jgi:GNAT superfamily N-acetyltransferase
MMPMNIEEIAFGSEKYKSLLKLRYEILRKPRDIELSDKDTAADDKKIHIAAFENEKPVGCVLLKPLNAQTLWLHQMAVLKEHQGQGIGARLIRHAEALAAARGFSMIDMHANRSAQGFYKKLGYVTEGEEFIENAVPAIRMIKSLSII